MKDDRARFDVVVVGAGNAALCAALSARDAGASVVVLEKAPASEQGGNCPYTGGGFRFTHEGYEDVRSLQSEPAEAPPEGVSMAPYTAEDFREHLTTVTFDDVDHDLMEVLIAQSRPTVDWMHQKGVEFELPTTGRPSTGAPSVIPNTVALSAVRSGPGLVQMLTSAARRSGIIVLYETKMLKLLQDGLGKISSVVVQDSDGIHEIDCGGLVLACGGFEANQEMRIKYLGQGWEKAKVRGAKYNTGDGHRAALDVGAKPFGQWTGCHATPIDADAPVTGVLEVTDAMPRRSYPLGIMVNVSGLRFVDEGEGFAEQTFVKVGRLILEQERSRAFQIFDGKALPHLEARYGTAKVTKADSIAELAAILGMNPGILRGTVDAFNAEAHDGDYRPRELDGRATNGIVPPKSNWAIRLDAPPFVAYAVTGGITYTYGGLGINTDAQVLNMEDKPIPGLYAAGEIVGGIFYHNSLRAAGLMHGSVFGKIAGANAAHI